MHTNALAFEKSLYLRQHAQNPVDWLPWGETAFQKARTEDKPIFLSVGYSTCHWCHVMAHESFEDERVAEALNRDFVPVKVDREERPDVDRVYMLFVQASTGSGGWPMSVWLTPDLKPFFGGTYFPPDNRYGRPGFLDLLGHLARAWKQDRARIDQSSNEVLDQLRAYTGTSNVTLAPDRALFEAGVELFRRNFDSNWGGFGGAPKFPRPVVFNYLLRTENEDALDMTVETLEAMARGGVHDQLGGGFHRYSVDERWFVPHFEKMLYDQAQLATSYLEAHQITGRGSLAQVARDIFTYVLRDLTSPEGAFYSAEDADSPDFLSPGHNREGAFYVWRYSEIQQLLEGSGREAFCHRYGVREHGNVDQDPHGEFESQNILYQAMPVDEVARRIGRSPEETAVLLNEAGRKLFEARGHRPRPHLDDKVLTGWNALMISALVKGALVLQDSQYLAAATRAMEFVSQRLGKHGRLLRRFCGGEAAIPAFLDDYAFTIQALLDLFEATGQADYLSRAVEFANGPLTEFEDPRGGFFSTAEHAESLVLRVKDDYDGAEPSGNSVATDVLLRLAHLTGDDNFRRRGVRSVESFAPKLKAQPVIAPQMLVAVGRLLSEPAQVVVRSAGDDAEAEELLRKQRAMFVPYSVTLHLTDSEAEALSATAPFISSLERKGRLTIYECRNFACQLPVVVS